MIPCIVYLNVPDRIRVSVSALLGMAFICGGVWRLTLQMVRWRWAQRGAEQVVLRQAGQRWRWQCPGARVAAA